MIASASGRRSGAFCCSKVSMSIIGGGSHHVITSALPIRARPAAVVPDSQCTV